MTLQSACSTGFPVVRKKSWIGERERIETKNIQLTPCNTVSVSFPGADFNLEGVQTNKPHFFLQIVSCIREPQVISGVGGGCAPPAHFP